LDAPGVLEGIARKRGCLLKGRSAKFENAWDLEKAAMLLLTDYRSGTLGRISLETPTSRQAMLAAARQKLTETPVVSDEVNSAVNAAT
jgi:ribosome biogenesis GTPase A